MTSAFVVLCMFTVRATFQSRQLRWLKCLKWLKCLTVCLLQMLLYFYSLITLFKAGFPLSKKKKSFICFNESTLKMMKNAYSILKALLVFIFKFLCWLFGLVETTAWFER